MDENKSNEFCASISNLLPVHNDLLELVQENKQIPSFLNKLTLRDPKLQRLKKAIHKGNFRATIWNHSNCNLYLIYLIQEKMIPFWQGITAYVYLIAKMQYTKTQKLRREDQDVKFNYRVNIVSLVKAGKITELGYQYLLGLTQGLESLNVHLNIDQLTRYVLKLPRIEQWLIKTEFNHHMAPRGGYDANRLVCILMNNVLFMQKISAGSYEERTTQYLVPSSSVINYCLQALNERPMRMRPILGNPGLGTLYHWHEQDFHPVSLYAKQILSNPKNADGYRCGPFVMWLHDIGHTFWASMLSKSQRDYIFTTYIPALRCLKDMAEAYSDDTSMEFLKETEKKAYDFDLTAVVSYLDENSRFKTYLAHTIGKNPIYPNCLYLGTYEYEAIGRAEGDRLYFLLHRSLYDPKVSESYKTVYKTLINFISTGESFRNQRIVNALQTLAKNAVSEPLALFARGSFQCEVDLLVCRMLINSDQTSEELWIKMTDDQDLAEKLLEMIEQGLNFFHPYLPMTPSKRLEMLDLLEKQPQAKISIDRGSSGNIKVKCRPQFFSICKYENNFNTLSSTEPNCYTHSK